MVEMVFARGFLLPVDFQPLALPLIDLRDLVRSAGRNRDLPNPRRSRCCRGPLLLPPIDEEVLFLLEVGLDVDVPPTQSALLLRIRMDLDLRRIRYQQGNRRDYNPLGDIVELVPLVGCVPFLPLFLAPISTFRSLFFPPLELVDGFPSQLRWFEDRELLFEFQLQIDEEVVENQEREEEGVRQEEGLDEIRGQGLVCFGEEREVVEGERAGEDFRERLEERLDESCPFVFEVIELWRAMMSALCSCDLDEILLTSIGSRC